MAEWCIWHILPHQISDLQKLPMCLFKETANVRLIKEAKWQKFETPTTHFSYALINMLTFRHGHMTKCPCAKGIAAKCQSWGRAGWLPCHILMFRATMCRISMSTSRVLKRNAMLNISICHFVLDITTGGKHFHSTHIRFKCFMSPNVAPTLLQNKVTYHISCTQYTSVDLIFIVLSLST